MRDILAAWKEQAIGMIGSEVTPVIPQKNKALSRENCIAILIPLTAANENTHLL